MIRWLKTEWLRASGPSAFSDERLEGRALVVSIGPVQIVIEILRRT